MKIVLDTNALHDDYRLSRPALVSIASASERANCAVYVPEVVVAEHVKHFRDARRSAASDLIQAARDVERLFGIGVSIPDVDAARDDADEVVRGRLADLGIGVLPTPAATHVEVMIRAVSRKPPFSKDGRGYQDTLVWLSARELAAAGETVVLVSGDAAFGERDLAPVFAEEIVRAGAGIVLLEKSLSGALDAHVQPLLKRLIQFEESLVHGTSKLDLKAWLTNELPPLLRDHQSREATEKDASLAFEWMGLDDPSFEILEARALSSGEAFVRVKVMADGHVGGWRWTMGGPDDVDRDWDESHVKAEVELELIVLNEEAITSHTVLRVSPSGVIEPREPDSHNDND